MATPFPNSTPELLTRTASILQQIISGFGPDAGDIPIVRQAVYKIIHAQSASHKKGAIYNDLTCKTGHGELIGSLESTTEEDKQPITLSCGDTFCRGCINRYVTERGNKVNCPNVECNAIITDDIMSISENKMIKQLLGRLKPVVAATGGAGGSAMGGSRKTRLRKYRRNHRSSSKLKRAKQ
jgi:hypothetical protein